MLTVDDQRMTVAALARARGVSKQIVSRQVKALERDGLITVERRGQRVLVDPAQFEAARSQVSDPARAEFAKAKPAVDTTRPLPDDPEDATFQAVRRQREQYQMELTKLQLDRERGEVIAIRDIEQALVDCGHRIAQSFDQLGQYTDELVSLAKDGGANKVRAFLREKSFEMRDSITRHLAAAAARAAGGKDGDDDDEG